MKNNLIVIIYAGLSKKEPIKDIEKKLHLEVKKNKEVNQTDAVFLLVIALKSLDRLSKKIVNYDSVHKQVEKKYGSNVKGQSVSVILGIYVLDLLIKIKLEKNLSKKITQISDEIEAESKEEAINENIEKNRNYKIPKIFYLASEHKDSASDHKDFQGKMYIDEKWKTLISDVSLLSEIEKYITRNNVQTVQWVMGKPVWFITRPNCRHYFKTVETKEVLSSSRKKLIDKYEMYTAIVDRQYFQTINSNKKDLRNAQLVLEKYKQRLELHQAMYKENPTNILYNAIEKDKMLIKKWEDFIKNT